MLNGKIFVLFQQRNPYDIYAYSQENVTDTDETVTEKIMAPPLLNKHKLALELTEDISETSVNVQENETYIDERVVLENASSTPETTSLYLEFLYNLISGIELYF